MFSILLLIVNIGLLTLNLYWALKIWKQSEELKIMFESIENKIKRLYFNR